MLWGSFFACEFQKHLTKIAMCDTMKFIYFKYKEILTMKNYVIPEVELISLVAADVITASGNDELPDQGVED